MDLNAFGVWLSNTSLPLVAAILSILAFGALFAGWLLRKWRAPDPQDNESLLISSVLGLLALLLGFTFSLASDRFDARRLLVQQEANAIGTMYLRARLLDEPYRSRISAILVAYTDTRIELARARPDQTADLLLTNDRLLREFWNESAAAFPSIRGLDFSSTFYDSVNEVIDLDGMRKSARLARVPTAVLILLFLYVPASALMLGFFSRTTRNLMQASFFLCLLVLFLVVIIDIDQPTLGAIRESQEPMERMRAGLTPNWPARLP